MSSMLFKFFLLLLVKYIFYCTNKAALFHYRVSDLDLHAGSVHSTAVTQWLIRTIQTRPWPHAFKHTHTFFSQWDKQMFLWPQNYWSTPPAWAIWPPATNHTKHKLHPQITATLYLEHILSVKTLFSTVLEQNSAVLSLS